jgi:hypothetical protein
VGLASEQRDEPVGRFRAVETRKLTPDDAMGFLQQVEDAGHRAHRRRCREQPQRVSGRCGVNDHAGVLTGGADPDDLEHAEQFVDAGDRQVEQRVDVITIEPGAVLDRITERAPMFTEPARERLGRVELDPEQRAPWTGRNAPGPRRQSHPERVAERMGWVGGDNQDTVATPGRLEGAHRGAGRLTDTALAAIELQPEIRMEISLQS